MALVPSEGDSGPEESDEDDHEFEAPGLFSNQRETEQSWATLEQRGTVEELKKELRWTTSASTSAAPAQLGQKHATGPVLDRRPLNCAGRPAPPPAQLGQKHAASRALDRRT
ncbi:hypothetical protein Q3G72_010389 [Acer saccharum]|nr:hypothetical protein Q3G72_010389 [Acer saccharum]